MTHREFAAAMGMRCERERHGATAPSRQRLARVAEVLGTRTSRSSPPTTSSGTRSCRSSPTVSEEVFDATVLGIHNFVANGIAVHN